MKDNAELTDRDHRHMDAFLGHVLDDYKFGALSKERAIAALAHVMAALDLDNYPEARAWFEQGNTFLSPAPFAK
jgi:hypothetical protein